MQISRRSLLSAAGGLAAVAVGSTLVTPPARAAARAVSTAGTTLEQAAAPASASGYSRLVAGPGYPLVVRAELCAAQAGRDDRRTALAAFVQLTDLHFVDAQSPMRVEWMHNLIGSAFRPHEALGTRANAALVDRVNSIGAGPYTGRRFDAVVSTGDNTDNHEHVELEWFLTGLSGGMITPNTGSASRWEGVQTRNNTLFWQPESSLRDDYKAKGFPEIDGYFARVMAAHRSAGLATPWFSVFGNHDDSVQGTFPSSWPTMAATYTGGQKVEGFADAGAQQAANAAVANNQPVDLANAALITVPVTPDARRAPFTPFEYMQAHLDAAYTGPGPFGHGFTQNNLDSGAGYYAFPIAPGVTGIAMDSTNRAGFTDGSLDDRQWWWLQRTLEAGSSLFYDWAGVAQRHQVTDQLFVLFSHHTSDTMGNLLLPGDGTGIRHAGFELRDLLFRYPNVVAWVNGHTHANKITPRPHSDPKRSWWEINTASHIDFPQHARLLELVDNGDTSLSIFTTLIESQAPYQASYDTASVAGMASLAREFAYNDPHRSPSRMGSDADHNTELLLRHPLR